MKQTFKDILKASLCGIIAGLVTFGIILVVIGLFSKKTDYNYDIYRSKIELKYYSTKDAIIEEIDNYIDSVAPGSCLNGIAIFEACEEYDVDIKFVLAQGQLESHFGTTGIASKTNSVWNVMAYDGKTAQEMIRKGEHFNHPDKSIKPYLELLTKDYLTNGKTEYDLMENFVNKSSKRYASSKTYESQLRGIYQRIDLTTNITAKYAEYKHYKILNGK